MTTTRPRVLVGCPTYDGMAYCLDKYVHALRSLTFPCDILLVDNSADDTYAKRIENLGIPVVRDVSGRDAKQRIVSSRNILRQRVLDGNYDYLFSLEQDVIPPADVIERLLAHRKAIVGGVYANAFYRYDGKMEAMPVVWIGVPDDVLTNALNDQTHPASEEVRSLLASVGGDASRLKIQLTLPQLDPPRLMRVKCAGLGCMLIARNVLENIPFRCDPSQTMFDDFFFSEDAERQGFELFADTGLRCNHLVGGKR